MQRLTQASALISLIIGGSALAGSTIDPVLKYAWGENIGWTNWADADGGARGIDFAPTFLSGFIWGENVGWINAGDGSPADGVNYANLNGTEFGVNIDPDSGTLFGYAWGENIGWINFDTSSLFSDAARFDFCESRFRGYAWGENMGWINMDDSQRYVAAVSDCRPPELVAACTLAPHKTGPGVTTEFGLPLNLDNDPLTRTSEPRDFGIRIFQFDFSQDVCAAEILITPQVGPQISVSLILIPGDNGPKSRGRIDFDLPLMNRIVHTITVTATSGPGCDLRHDLCVSALVGDFNSDGEVITNDKAEMLGFIFQPITAANAKYDLQVGGSDSGIIEVADLAAWTGFFGTSTAGEPCPAP